MRSAAGARGGRRLAPFKMGRARRALGGLVQGARERELRDGLLPFNPDPPETPPRNKPPATTFVSLVAVAVPARRACIICQLHFHHPDVPLHDERRFRDRLNMLVDDFLA